MRITRVYEPQTLSTGAVLELSETNASHLGRVLRLPAGAEIAVFDGQGHECAARLMFEGRKALAQITALKEHNPESPLYTVLGQVISRGDKMDFTIQKAVELGISEIYPLTSVRCGVKLNAERFDKKIAAWQKVAIAACEQCGRSTVPTVHPVTALSDFCASAAARCELNLTLDPTAGTRLRDLTAPSSIALLIGPEGGFDQAETALAAAMHFTGVSLGPRILRTETAALTALAALNALFGDL